MNKFGGMYPDLRLPNGSPFPSSNVFGSSYGNAQADPYANMQSGIAHSFGNASGGMPAQPFAPSQYNPGPRAQRPEKFGGLMDAMLQRRMYPGGGR